MSRRRIERDLDHASWRAARPAFLLLVLSFCAILLFVSTSEAGGTVTETKSFILTRSGVTQTPNPPSLVECLRRMSSMIKEELARRTTGYVTYRCMDVSQSYVKFSKTPVPPPPPPPPVASLQVYACADAGADGRILESATVAWPNCPTASYQNPSKTLVVASNTDGVLRWLLKPTGRVWAREGTVESWKRVEDINWETVTPPPPPPPPAGSGNLTWTPSPSPNVAGYRLLYGTSPDQLVQSVDVIPPEPRTLKVPGLKSGQLYHFRMQAYATDGGHGPLSNLLSVTIQ